MRPISRLSSGVAVVWCFLGCSSDAKTSEHENPEVELRAIWDRISRDPGTSDLEKYLAYRKQRLLIDERGRRDERKASKQPAAAQPRDPQLAGLPYLASGNSAPASSGVLRHDATRSLAGYNLYTSGHAPEAFLIDMEGKVVHRWFLDRNLVLPTRKDVILDSNYFRKAEVFENGDLLVLFEYGALARLDARSKILWAYTGDDRLFIGPHHDWIVRADGTIQVLAARLRHVPEIHRHGLVVEDLIVTLDKNGKPIAELSLPECFERSAFANFLHVRADLPAPVRASDLPQDMDWMHTNTLRLLGPEAADISPAFREGNLLISSRQISMIAVIDPEKKQVVWAQIATAWFHQHEPQILADGHLLVFDNDYQFRRRSRVVELDLRTFDVVWSYDGADLKPPFYSALLGSQQRLSNGNTLVSDSMNGRALEVTPDNQVAWEFVNPHMAFNQFTEQDAVAILPEMTRIDPATLRTQDWAKK